MLFFSPLKLFTIPKTPKNEGLESKNPFSPPFSLLPLPFSGELKPKKELLFLFPWFSKLFTECIKQKTLFTK